MERWQAKRISSAKDELLRFIGRCDAEMEQIATRRMSAAVALAQLGDIDDVDLVRRARKGKP